MKCLSTLEWNKDTLGQLRSNYAALLEADVLRNDPVLPEPHHALILVVDIERQELCCFREGSPVCCYKISTALNGAGCLQNTDCTPLGWHRIVEKIGGNEPLGTIFKSRVVSGVADSLSSAEEDDLVTSRIMWLSGLQPAVNYGGTVDSYSRYIYIHGTAQEHLIGTPVSHGCIRMLNEDVIALYDLIDENSLVVICESVQQLLKM